MVLIPLIFITFFGWCDAAREHEVSKNLIVVTNADYPPFEFFDGERIVGFDADMVRYIADEMGCSVEIRDMSFGGILQLCP